MSGLSPKPSLDNFRVKLPSDFFFDGMKGVYLPLIQRFDTLFDNLNDYVEESVQAFLFPNLSYTPTEYTKRSRSARQSQNNPESAEVYQRNSASSLQLLERKISITFRLNSNFLNYIIMLDQYFRYFNHDESRSFLGDILYQIFDTDGRTIIQVKFGSVVFTGITGFETDYSANAAVTNSFTCDFYFNDFEVSVSNI